MATQVSGVNGWLRLNHTQLLFGPKEENLDAQVEENKENSLRVTPKAPEDLQIYIDGERLETEVYGRWLWRPRDYAGLYSLLVKTPDGLTASTQVRVLPSKLSQERYEQMLEDISKISSDLLFRLSSPAREYAMLRHSRKQPSALSEFALVRHLLQELDEIVASIRQSPHTQLGITSEVRMLHEVAHFAGNVLPVPGEALFVGFGAPTSQRPPFLPRHWLVERQEATYDVAENRLLKQFLWRQLQPRIQRIRERAETELARRRVNRDLKRRRGWEDDESPVIAELEQAVIDCTAFMRQCVAWASVDFLRTVGWQSVESRPTQVLQKHPHYSRFYRLYLRFQAQLKYTNNADRYITQIAMRKLAELYEIWAVFVMTRILLDLLTKRGYAVVSSNGFYELADDQFQFEIKREAAIELSGHDQRVVIRYEPVYPSARTHPSGMVADARTQLTPDLAVEVWRGGEVVKALIFDAKYKIFRDKGIETYWEEDLEKMDHYLRAIRWKPANPRFRPQSVVASAYILYPGAVLEHNSDYPEVGALPLKPKGNNAKQVLAALLDILKNASFF